MHSLVATALTQPSPSILRDPAFKLFFGMHSKSERERIALLIGFCLTFSLPRVWCAKFLGEICMKLPTESQGPLPESPMTCFGKTVRSRNGVIS